MYGEITSYRVTPTKSHDMTVGSGSPPVRIGLSARLLHQAPREMGFRNKRLQYLEQSVAHWVIGHGAVAVMVPTLGEEPGAVRRVSVNAYADMLDGLVLQGGADVSPHSYGAEPLDPRWIGDKIRDRYELELIETFMKHGKPIFGICRGCQLLNVTFGGTLVQDLPTLRPDAAKHLDEELYDQHTHDVTFVAGSRLAALYPEATSRKVSSIHHQAIDRLGSGLAVEAHSSDDGIIEAIRDTGTGLAFGVQWHPEFDFDRPERLDPSPILTDFIARAARDKT